MAGARAVVSRRPHDQEIVERFERVAASRLEQALRIADLCEAVGVSEGVLASACRAVRGATPARHLRSMRLAAARQALLSADAEAQTITRIAMRFGFRELGRFAVQYRSSFGETPSQTLRRAAAARRRAPAKQLCIGRADGDLARHSGRRPCAG
jgi:AraC-like DNA-binding protein